MIRQLLLAIFLTLLFITTACVKKSGIDQNESGKQLTTIEELTIQIGTDPSNIDLLMNRAKLYTESGKHPQAANDLQVILHKDSLNLPALHLLADVYLDGLQSNLALQTMTRAARLYPDSLRTQLKLSEFQFLLRQYEASKETIGKVLQKDPQNAEALFMLGMNYKDQGDIPKAAAAFQSAVELDPDLIDAWIILGSLMDEMDNPIAERYFDNALLIDSLNVEAHHAKAFYLQNKDRIPEALILYQKIERIAPTYKDAYLNAGILHFLEDDLESSKREFQSLITLDSTFALAYYYLAQIEEKGPDPEKALKYYDQALSFAPSMDKVRLAQETLLAKLGK